MCKNITFNPSGQCVCFLFNKNRQISYLPLQSFVKNKLNTIALCNYVINYRLNIRILY